nr:hypothetical protein [Tanacetum cinerariifolium]
FQDTANSEKKKETKGMVLYQMETEEVSIRLVAPCFVNGLEAYDDEINLGVKENMISNEYAVKLCLEHEVKKWNKEVKKELTVALRGEIYLVKFIINPKEDDVEPEMIFETEEEEKSNDDWDRLLDFNIDDGPLLGEEGLSPFVCRMRKSSLGGHLTQEEATKEAIAIRMSQKFALLEEERPIIETMAYHDKYKKIIAEVWKDKVELNGKIVKEEEEARKRIKGEASKEKDDPRAEDMRKVDRGITMINHTQAEAMRILTNVLCQVRVTTLIAKFLILDIPIDRDSSIVVGRGFLCTIGGIVNTQERLFSTFDGFCHQTFRAARSDIMRNAESDSDDVEDYQIKRNKFGAPVYGPKPAPYLNYNDPAERSLAIETTMETHDDKVGSSRSKRTRQHETVDEVLLPQVHYEFLIWEGCNRDAKSRMGCNGEIDDMLKVRLREAGSNEEIFTSAAWIRAFNINEPIYVELCHKFYSTYEFDEFISKIARKCKVLTEDVVRSLSALVYCRDLDTITLRELIDSDGKLIPEDPQPGIPRGAYNPPGYAQPQYDQYYQQYPPLPPQYQQQQDDE